MVGFGIYPLDEQGGCVPPTRAVSSGTKTECWVGCNEAWAILKHSLSNLASHTPSWPRGINPSKAGVQMIGVAKIGSNRSSYPADFGKVDSSAWRTGFWRFQLNANLSSLLVRWEPVGMSGCPCQRG